MTYHQILIAGDSNVARFLPVVKAAKKDGELQATSLLRATNAIQLKEQLSSPKETSDHVVVAALTNIITSHVYKDSTTLVSFCERTFSEMMTWVEAGRANLPGANTHVCCFIHPFCSCFLPFCIYKLMNCQESGQPEPLP